MILWRTSLLAIFGVLALATGTGRPPTAIPRSQLSPQVAPSPARQDALIVPCSGGVRLERKLASGEEQVCEINLATGDFLAAEVDQQGVDVLVMLLDPAGKIVLRMDSPNGRRGEEPICAVARSPGFHRLKVIGTGKGWQGIHRLHIQKIRTASEADRACDTALGAVSEGDALKRDQPDQAVERYNSALRIWADAGSAWGQVVTLRRLGDISESYGRIDDALSHYLNAIPLSRALKDRRAEAHLHVRSGLILLSAGELRQAQTHLQTALTLAEESADREAQAYSHSGLGVIARLAGRIQLAMAAYGRAQELFRQLEEYAEEARVHSNRGVVLLAAGQPEAALDAYNEALRLLRLEDRADVRSAVLNGAAQAFHVLGDRRRAFLIYRRSLHLAVRSTDRARILQRLATVLRDEGNTGWAYAIMEEALQLSRRHGDLRSQAYVLAELAHLDDERGLEAESIRKSNQALKILEKIEEPPAVASALFGRAEAERDLGWLDAAITSIEGSIRAVESLRSDIVDVDLRMTFFADRHRYYELYLDLLLRQGRHVQAFEAGEQSRARSLLDDMSEEAVVDAMKLAKVQREVLDTDSLLLSYLLGKERSTLWAVTADSISVFDLPSRIRIEEAVRKARNRLFEGGKGDEVEALSSILFPANLGPLGKKRLLIVPDGELHMVPFAALCDPAMPGGCRRRSPLILNHEVVHLPSASVVGRMRKKLAGRRPAAGNIGVLADPVFQRRDERLLQSIGDPRQGEREVDEGLRLQKLQRLRMTQREAKEILALYPAEARFGAVGFNANLATARSAEFLENRILHFATHNVVSDHPALSGLVLARFDELGRPVDGFLAAPEIYNFKLPADLVVLSACSTGAGREVRGEGMIGLTRAFLHAGARRVMVSLWDVQEGDTSDLMILFYQGLQQGLTPSLALQAAQKAMIAEELPSRSWAGFVLQGEPR